jgi:hypothetical protein
MLLMSGALVVVILPLNHAFVVWWVGTTQYGGWELTLALAAMMLLRHLNVATIYTLFCFGYERQISLTSLADGVVTVLGTALLVWTWGPIGAPLGSIIGALFVSLPVNCRSIAHEMGLSTGEFAAMVLPLLLRIVTVGGAAAVASHWTGPDLRLSLVLMSAAAALYTAMVLPLAWRGPVGPYLRMALRLNPAVGDGILPARLIETPLIENDRAV